MNTPFRNWIRKHQLIAFFVLTYLIMFGVTFAHIYLNPSQPIGRWSLVWFFSIFSPSISAFIVAWVIGGMHEIGRLLAGFARWKVGLQWYFWAAFLILGPLAITLIYKALGNPGPGLTPGETIPTMLGTIAFQFFPVRSLKKWVGAGLPCLVCRQNIMPWFQASSLV